MPKPKIIFLTTETISLNDIGKERVQRALERELNKEDEDNPKEYSKQWYNNLGVNPPEDAEDDDYDDGMVELDDDEVEVIENDVLLERSEYSHCIDRVKTTTVFTKSGHFFEALETAEMIYEQLRYLDQNIIERFINELKMKYYKIKNK